MPFPTKGLINFWGLKNSGKSTFFEKNVKHVKFEHDILKSREKTLDFMDRMRYSKLPLVLDDFESIENLTGVKEISGSFPVAFYIISNSKVTSIKFDDYYEFKGVDVKEFAESLGISVDDATKKIKEYDGNLSAVKIDVLNFKSLRDDLSSPKMYVSSLLKTQEPIGESLISRVMIEHGHTFGLMHENCIDYTSNCETLSLVSHSFSDADMIDCVVYKDMSWDLIQFFNVSACLIPACLLKGGTQTPRDLRPGSMWTKYSNACMKSNRLKRLKLNRDCIGLIVGYINSQTELPISLDSYDLDTVNQLSFSEKIKPKLLSKLKSLVKK